MADSRLAPCPKSPNCVCSRADAADRVHYIAPLRVEGPGDAALARVKAAALGMPRATLLDEAPGYLKVLFKTRLVRFRDDVEFEWDEGEQVVHVRSASRLGYGDLGVNRARVEAIRARLGSR